MDIKTDDTPTVEGLAIRTARLARTLLSWDDSRLALRRAVALLNEWQDAQEKLPNRHDTDDR